MDQEEQLRDNVKLLTVDKDAEIYVNLFRATDTIFHIIPELDMKWIVHMSSSAYVAARQISFHRDTKPYDIFLLIADALRGKSVSWHFGAYHIDAALRDAIASVAFDGTAKLVELDVRGGDSHPSLAGLIAPLIVPPSTIRTLGAKFRTLTALPRTGISLDKIRVGDDRYGMDVLSSFVRTAGVKSLALEAWPLGGPLEEMPGITSIEIDMINSRAGAIDPLCTLIRACPNLKHLSLEHDCWEDGGETLTILLSHLADIEILCLPVDERSIPVILPYLMRMKSLRALQLFDYMIHPRLMAAIIWHVPRLMVLRHGEEGSDFIDMVFQERNAWLYKAALVSYLPLGDLHRELVGYL
jgi:hypothetical protein